MTNFAFDLGDALNSVSEWSELSLEQVEAYVDSSLTQGVTKIDSLSRTIMVLESHWENVSLEDNSEAYQSSLAIGTGLIAGVALNSDVIDTSLEGVKDTASSVATGIKNAFKAFVRLLNDLFIKFQQATGMLEDQINKLEDEIKKAEFKDNKDFKPTAAFSKLSAQLLMDGKKEKSTISPEEFGTALYNLKVRTRRTFSTSAVILGHKSGTIAKKNYFEELEIDILWAGINKEAKPILPGIDKLIEPIVLSVRNGSAAVLYFKNKENFAKKEFHIKTLNFEVDSDSWSATQPTKKDLNAIITKLRLLLKESKDFKTIRKLNRKNLVRITKSEGIMAGGSNVIMFQRPSVEMNRAALDGVIGGVKYLKEALKDKV